MPTVAIPYRHAKTVPRTKKRHSSSEVSHARVPWRACRLARALSRPSSRKSSLPPPAWTETWQPSPRLTHPFSRRRTRSDSASNQPSPRFLAGRQGKAIRLCEPLHLQGSIRIVTVKAPDRALVRLRDDAPAQGGDGYRCQGVGRSPGDTGPYRHTEGQGTTRTGAGAGGSSPTTRPTCLPFSSFLLPLPHVLNCIHARCPHIVVTLTNTASANTPCRESRDHDHTPSEDR